MHPHGPDATQLADLVETSLDADKAEDITVIDLMGKSGFADIMVIASGRSSRQVGAMADHLMQKLKAVGLKPRVEGMQTGDWVLIDAGDVVVHLFRPEVRAFYNLEKMWGASSKRPTDGPTTDGFAAAGGVLGKSEPVALAAGL